MNAYKCARCGKMYEKQTESRLFIGKCKPKDDTGPRWREQDLCPECTKALENGSKPERSRKMTPEEAISIMKCAIGEVEWNYPLDYAEAFEVAIEALEKQVPKKPLHKCPTCGVIFVDRLTNYCKNCGQKISYKFYEIRSEINGKNQQL